MNDGGQVYLAGLAAGFRLPRRVSVSDWGDANVVLTTKTSAEPGPWRTARVPYLRGIFDCLSASSQVEEVIVVAGAQVGKTSAGLVWTGYIVDVDPGPIIATQPTDQMAKRYSKQRITPLFEDSPTLDAKVARTRARDETNTALLKEFEGGCLILAGANSPAGLRSMPAKFAHVDEEDAYPPDVGGEGDAISLIAARQVTFARRKRLRTSTPTDLLTSTIWPAYQASDRARYWVPCPHCGEFQVLKWANVRWPAAQPERAHYVCEHCGAEIEEHHKAGMLEAGEWRSEDAGAKNGKVRGFHLPALYSPVGWKSWADCAIQFTDAKKAADAGDQTKLKAFINLVLAEPWEEQGDRTDGVQLARRVEDYRLRVVPAGGLVLTAAVDVQGNRLELKVKAWGRSEESWLVDYAVLWGDPATEALWQQLDELLRAPLVNVHGKELRIRAVAIDSGGHHTHEVYTFCRDRRHRHIFAVKGQSQAAKPILGKPSDVEINYRGQRIKRGAQVWPVGADTAKGVIYGRLRVADPGPGYLHFPKDLPADYFEQLTCERLVTRYHKGRPRYEWVKPAGKRNEALDLEVYNLAAAIYVGVARYSERDWARLERDLGPDLFSGPAAPPPAPDPLAAVAPPPEKKQPPRARRRVNPFVKAWKK